MAVTPAAALGAALTVMSRPFVWGSADCCTAACDAFAALHGIDPMAPLRGRYDDAAGARREIRARGGFMAMARGLAASAGLVRGTGEPGEIAVVSGPMGPALALGLGAGLYLQKSEGGLATVSRARISWKVA